MTRFALLLSLLGALGLVACEDDDEAATAGTEVITSDFGQDPPAALSWRAARTPVATTGRGLARRWSGSRCSMASFAVARRGAC